MGRIDYSESIAAIYRDTPKIMIFEFLSPQRPPLAIILKSLEFHYILSPSTSPFRCYFSIHALIATPSGRVDEILMTPGRALGTTLMKSSAPNASAEAERITRHADRVLQR